MSHRLKYVKSVIYSCESCRKEFDKKDNLDQHRKSIPYLFVRYCTPKDFYSKNEDFVDILYVCSEYWYYHSFTNKLKNCWKAELACAVALFRNVPIFKLFAEIIGVLFPPNFIWSVFITLYYSVSSQSGNMCSFVQLNFSGYSGPYREIFWGHRFLKW